MKYTVNTFGILIAALLTGQISQAKYVPSTFSEAHCRRFNDISKLAMSSSCNRGFCSEKHHYYPQDQIDCLLTKKYNLTLERKNQNPIHRSSGNGDEDDDCPNIVDYQLIYGIIDKNSDVRVVVQSDNKKAPYTQIIRIEQCQTPGRLSWPTSHFRSYDVDRYDIRCEETTVDYYFLVLTHDWQALEFVRSKHGIPVSCDCRYHGKKHLDLY